MKKITPILLVEAIEPCLELWVNRLGWEKTAEVPEGGLSPPAVGDSPEPNGSRGWGPRDQQGDDAPTTNSGDDRLGFVILSHNGLELMYQTRASIAKEVEKDGLPAAMNPGSGASVLYVEVENLAEVTRRVQGLDVILPYRETFYGAKELWMREPGGHLVGFAEMAR